MVRLPKSKGNLKSFEVNSPFEDPLHPLRLGNIDSQRGDAVRLGIPLGNFLGDVTTEGRAMECRRFAPKFSRITGHVEEGMRKLTKFSRKTSRLLDPFES